MTTNINLETYRRDLAVQYSEGLITSEELADSLTFIDGQREKPTYSIEIEERPQNDPVIQRLEDFYYRELFGRLQNENDDRLIGTEVLFGTVNGKAAGALWYAVEPSTQYRNCVYLDQLYVLNEFRGTKLGTHLLLELLQRTPEDHCIITFAWKPAIEFYRSHGFLTTNQSAEKEGEDDQDVQHFQKMVLPLTRASFNRYRKEKGEEYLEGLEDMITFLPTTTLQAEFTSKFVSAIANLKPKQESDLSQNPFTVFLYQRAGLEHVLLK